MRTISPIVSTDWLEKNLKNPKLIIIDIRLDEEYTAGHISDSVSIPFLEAMEQPNCKWFVERNGLLLEIPDEPDLFDTIGFAGIKKESHVVVVSRRALPHPLVDATIVADFIMYAGIQNIAVLDGGFEKWKLEGNPVSFDKTDPKFVKYNGSIDKSMFVSKEYVLEKIGKSAIIDCREPIEYFGGSIRPLWTRPGHIPTAKCLPSLWIWNEEMIYRDPDELRQMLQGVAGTDMSQEIIFYCGIGGFSSAWYFVLKEVLGYKNVKIYHGSAQEWTRDPETPLVTYRWE